MEENKVDLHLTSKQKSKYMKGQPFQMTADQCKKKSSSSLCDFVEKRI